MWHQMNTLLSNVDSRRVVSSSTRSLRSPSSAVGRRFAFGCNNHLNSSTIESERFGAGRNQQPLCISYTTNYTVTRRANPENAIKMKRQKAFGLKSDPRARCRVSLYMTEGPRFRPQTTCNTISLDLTEEKVHLPRYGQTVFRLAEKGI